MKMRSSGTITGFGTSLNGEDNTEEDLKFVLKIYAKTL